LEDIFESYRRAGSIVRKLRDLAPRIVRPKVKLIDICERIEDITLDMGGQPAFPCNIGINEVAAHYTSPAQDPSVIPNGSIIKVDFGAHVDGCIADSAVTICLNPMMEPMVMAAEEALTAALSHVRAGVRTSDIGSVIESAIEKRGFRPIRNLTGHMLDRYVVHTGQSVPNISGIGGAKLKEGQVCAIEPFVTRRKATGEVVDGRSAYIYRLLRRKGAEGTDSRRLVEFIEKRYRTLPFAKRWLVKLSTLNMDSTLSRLLQSKCVMEYPVLLERSGAPVSQAEHTVLVTRDGFENLTGPG